MKARPLFVRLAWGAAVGAIASVAYRTIQFVQLDRALVRQECWTWTWLPFHPAWIFPYASMFVLVGLPWFLLPDLRGVRRFALTLLAVAAVGWVTFLVYPTACARPTADGQPDYYGLLLAFDAPNNCLPCLHSAFALLAACVLARESAAFRSTAARLLLGLWLLLMSVSIIALRQHTDTDVLAGLVLGGTGAWFFQLPANTSP